jgi:hypothetical protein
MRFSALAVCFGALLAAEGGTAESTYHCCGDSGTVEVTIIDDFGGMKSGQSLMIYSKQGFVKAVDSGLKWDFNCSPTIGAWWPTLRGYVFRRGEDKVADPQEGEVVFDLRKIWKAEVATKPDSLRVWLIVEGYAYESGKPPQILRDTTLDRRSTFETPMLEWDNQLKLGLVVTTVDTLRFKISREELEENKEVKFGREKIEKMLRPPPPPRIESSPSRFRNFLQAKNIIVETLHLGWSN